jgi:hypothetical protein
MKIKETFNDFTNFIFAGFNTYHIDCNKDGSETTITDLLDLAKHYNRVYFVGEDTQRYSDEIVEFAKKMQKINDKTLIQVHVTGTLFNAPLARCENIIFIVVPELNGDKPYSERIKPELLKKYGKNESFFVFSIETKDDIDKVSLLMSEAEIQPYIVFFLAADPSVKDACKEYAKSIGANVILGVAE